MNKIKELLAKLKEKALELVENAKIVFGIKQEVKNEQLSDNGVYHYTVTAVYEPKDDTNCDFDGCVLCDEDDLDDLDYD